MKNSLLDAFNTHMILCRLSPKTQKAYLHAVKGLADFYHKSPDQLSDQQIQYYLAYLIKDRKLAWSSCNVVFSGLRLFYLKIVKWDETSFTIPPRGRQKKLPIVLSCDEVQRLIDAAKNIKHRVFLMTVYSAGLRVSEAVYLKPCHIESNRMMIRVEQGKGRKDRYTLLSKTLLHELRNYWRCYRPNEWLFFAQDRNRAMPVGTAQKIFYSAKQKAGITNGRGIHTLRYPNLNKIQTFFKDA